MKREDIIAEYNKTEIHYKAMVALLKAENITVDSEQTTPQTETTAPQTPTAQPVAEQATTPKEEQKPTSTEPEIVYNGDKVINLAPSGKVSFYVDFVNVSSSKDYVISPFGSPTYITYSISGKQTGNTIRVTFDVKAAVNRGQGAFQIRIKNAPEKNLEILINVK